MTTKKNYDDLLYPILHSEGNIVGFFDRVFEFLYRRTDYFRMKKRDSDSQNVGLEPGEAENIVRSVFCKYMEKAVAEQQLHMDTDSVPLDYIHEEVVTTTDLKSSENISESSEVIACQGSKDYKSSSTVEDDQSEPKVPWMDPDCYNGARYEDYSWAQTVKDIDVHIKVPKNITTGKQVRVKINQCCIAAEVLSNGVWNTLKQGDLSWKINVEESAWTLVPGEHIHICLQKLKERWWDSLFPGEPKIDLKSIDPSIAYEDLDEESQAKINELMYNQQQKLQGKPTILQNKLQNVLKEAWNAEGSPFKGQPFDPSLVNLQNAENL